MILPKKCDICGGKVRNGICSECGMDYNRDAAYAVEDAAEVRYCQSDEGDDNNVSFVENWEVSERTKALNKKVLLCVILAVLTVLVSAIVGYFASGNKNAVKRAIERQREERLTTRNVFPEISIPDIKIPKVTMPEIDIPAMNDKIRKALENDRKVLQEQAEQRR